MAYSKIKLYTANGIPEALSNLWYSNDSSVVEIEDAVEDASDFKPYQEVKSSEKILT